MGYELKKKKKRKKNSRRHVLSTQHVFNENESCNIRFCSFTPPFNWPFALLDSHWSDWPSVRRVVPVTQGLITGDYLFEKRLQDLHSSPESASFLFFICTEGLVLFAS